MQYIAEFKKVSELQYNKDNFGANYEDIKLPIRATKGSAGYDIFTPIDIDLKAGEWITVNLGIRCVIDEDWCLMLMPKSGLALHYKMRLSNTVGLVDSDYSGADNEGHIKAEITVDKDLRLNAGEKLLQGVFIPYGITVDDAATGKRIGGFGSTGR